ncbi:MAG: glycoside hydrolase family 15 protein [Acidimicrobiales bacterium]
MVRRAGAADLVPAGVRAILAHQSDGGAFVASPDFSQYGYCWLRDGSFTAYALDRAGEHDAAGKYHDWVESTLGTIAEMMDHAVESKRAEKDFDPRDLPPARFALDGSVVADDWPNFQIDGYGTWLWALREHLVLAGETALSHRQRETVERVARYLVTFAFEPCFDVWEMNGTDVHTSTLACVYGGLVAASSLLGDPELSARADDVAAHVRMAGRVAGRYEKSDASHEVDASALWLSIPFEVVDLDDEVFEATVAAIEHELVLDGGVRRFASDTYFGGGTWPVLTCSLGWYYARAGRRDDAVRCRDWARDHLDASGRLAEQFGGELRDREHYAEWVRTWGSPAGDLLWSHAMHVVLSVELDDALVGRRVGASTDFSQHQPTKGDRPWGTT